MMLLVSSMLYYITKEHVLNPVLSGLSIIVISSVTAYVQRRGTEFFIQQSNIKYLKRRNDTYMLMISVYRLINVNLPVFYAILRPGEADTKSEHYSKIYVLIFTMIVSKTSSFLSFGYLLRGMLFMYRKRRYFC